MLVNMFFSSISLSAVSFAAIAKSICFFFRREKSLEAYQAQATCMVRMQHEIKTLKAVVRKDISINFVRSTELIGLCSLPCA